MELRSLIADVGESPSTRDTTGEMLAKADPRGPLDTSSGLIGSTWDDVGDKPEPKAENEPCTRSDLDETGDKLGDDGGELLTGSKVGAEIGEAVNLFSPAGMRRGARPEVSTLWVGFNDSVLAAQEGGTENVCDGGDRLRGLVRLAEIEPARRGCCLPCSGSR